MEFELLCWNAVGPLARLWHKLRSESTITGPETMRLVYIVTLLFLACCLLPSVSAGQSPHEPHPTLASMASSLVSGSTDDLPRLLSPQVGITMGGTTRVYDRNQALFVIRQFMSDYPSGGFSLQNSGISGGTAYATGLYNTRSGGTFEINIYVQVSGGTIDEIRFERS